MKQGTVIAWTALLMGCLAAFVISTEVNKNAGYRRQLDRITVERDVLKALVEIGPTVIHLPCPPAKPRIERKPVLPSFGYRRLD